MTGAGDALLQLVLGWLLADFLSGLLHWFEDRVGVRNVPGLHHVLVVPNRGHHADPMAFTRSGVLARSGSTWLAVGAVSALWAFAFGPSLAWAAATAGMLIINEAHRWAHRPAAAPRPVRILQEIGILQAGNHHARHHRAALDTHYCILTTWLNPVLDAVRFWQALERLLERAGAKIIREN